MKRREFISLLSGAAAWPLAARAQQGERMRRIGVLQGGAAEHSEMQARNAAFQQGLRQLGWIEGHNVKIDFRFGLGTTETIRKQAAELAASAPDVIVTSGSATTEVLQREARSVPVVFAIVPDPVGAGFVNSLARPGGNITGFMQGEYNLSGKWLELLKQIAPNVTRAAILRHATITSGIGQFAVIQSVAPSLGVDVRPVNIGSASEIESNIADFARIPNGGLILTSTPLGVIHRDLVVALAARHKLPAVYSNRALVEGGGLASYGANYVDLFRQTAGYVDRILKGEKPADLPVQAPTKYELIINLKTAKALGIDVPPTLLARADEVIE
jgi:putative ABC transport system substrate-binding protein